MTGRGVKPVPPSRRLQSRGEGVGDLVDLGLGGDQGRREAKRLPVGVLGEYAAGDEALAEGAATPLLRSDVDACPQPDAWARSSTVG